MILGKMTAIILSILWEGRSVKWWGSVKTINLKGFQQLKRSKIMNNF